MSRVDATELLVDTDFVDEMSLITRIPITDNFGEGSFQESVKTSVGSIQPADVKTVMKLPEAMRVDNVMSFWFRGPIVAAAPGRYADVLVFKGQRYQVQTTADWTSWGAGWTEGTCTMEAMT